MLNPIFPSIPLGTLAANLLGGFLIGVFMACTKNHLFFPETARLAITTGFLGGLTTFSTFSAETVTLISHQEYLLSAAIISCHVIGSILTTIFGIYTIKLITS
jgi:CrcB protein